MKFAVLLVAAAGCASGGSTALGQDDASLPADGSEIDAPKGIDAQGIDTPPPIDAMVDAMPDAVPDAAPDAFVCIPMTNQLLANPAFDLTPMGTGWTQTPIDAAFPPITDQDGPAEQSAPYKAWMGGFVAPTAGGTVTDIVYQDVVVPANTTALVLTGYYIVGTQESATATIAYDTASLAITQTNGTQIVAVNSFSNLTPAAAWTAINFTVPQNLSGQTIRLRITSSNDDSFVSNFFFDSFALNATHCP
jgi:hypothetical protein